PDRLSRNFALLVHGNTGITYEERRYVHGAEAVRTYGHFGCFFSRHAVRAFGECKRDRYSVGPNFSDCGQNLQRSERAYGWRSCSCLFAGWIVRSDRGDRTEDLGPVYGEGSKNHWRRES